MSNAPSHHSCLQLLANERATSALLAMAALFCLGMALFLQVSKDWPPCALCVMQRIGYIGAVAGFAMKAFGYRKTGNSVATLSTVAILYFAFSHLALMSKPKQGCSFDTLGMAINESALAQYLPFIFESEGTCWQTDISWWGLHLSSWSAIVATVFLLQLIYSLTSESFSPKAGRVSAED